MSNINTISQFTTDTISGLKSNPKRFYPKYFYDLNGIKLFEKITNSPSYMIGQSEIEILTCQTSQICSSFSKNSTAFIFIDLGIKHNFKTEYLIQHLFYKKYIFKYTPIDIHEDSINSIISKYKTLLPQLNIDAKIGNYNEVLEKLKTNQGIRKIILIPGSDIGNHNLNESISYLKNIVKFISPNDYLLIGFDLRKNPNSLKNSYFNSKKKTSNPNLYILSKINRELNANFKSENFIHHSIFDPIEGAIKNYIISKKNQTIEFKYTQDTIDFKAWEVIISEYSKKFSHNEINSLALETGFMVEKNFYSQNNAFSYSLWKKYL